MGEVVLDRKVCTKCHIEKPISDFYFRRSKERKNGYYTSDCKECACNTIKKWYRNGGKKKCQDHKATEAGKARVQRNRFSSRVRMHGISEEEYLLMYEIQDGACAICGNTQSIKHNGKVISLSIDHNHDTGQVRGLLCHHCNAMIGHAREDVDLLKKAIKYIETHNKSRIIN